MTMRHGMYLPNQGPFADVRLLADLARDAEECGWDGLFLWDEIFPIWSHVGRLQREVERGERWSEVVDTFVALTVIAAATRSIRFGALVTAVARMRPGTFAQQTATLDSFSGGRLVVGVGLGDPAEQFAAFGEETDARVRASMVDEFLALVAELWSGRTVDFRGTHYTARGVALSPRPVQQPRIPVWIGGYAGNRPPRRRAARWDGYVPASGGWPDEVVSPDAYRTIAADIGAERTSDAPFDLVVIGDAEGTAPDRATYADYAGAGVTWLLAQALSVDDARARIRQGPPR
jgi:alkanesulfonate monooxygenase SsuD/methylene tetrahydromethanopterin reductase-like flavin-dependent oxidoreductase (luciferase family)